MTKEEFEKLKAGDKVRIVRVRVFGMNDMGKMDKWLGKVMTVRERISDYTVRMVEDQHEYHGGWYWGKDMIECKISEEAAYEDDSQIKIAKDRVKKELAELEEEIEELSHKLAPLEAYNLLNLRLDVMRAYANKLLGRLATWKD